jgi:8-hydroxy-5-deazaflavin:NADPH oxidoreductase
MRIGVLGTGMVGEAIGDKLIALGHEVRMGARSESNPKASAFRTRHGERASHGTFADAARFGELVFLCARGDVALDVLALATREALRDKILIDVTNPLRSEGGGIPTLFVSNDDSLGEQIQRALPDVRVIKTLNTMNCAVMVDASSIQGPHAVFVCGNDADAKARVTTLLRDGFGHRDVLDLGDITGARATEGLMPLWLRLWGLLGTDKFNFAISR